MAVPMRLQCKSVLWRTPQPILQIVRSMFGGSIAYDPCADSGNWTQADVFRTSGGLDDEWDDRTFVNPPYNDDNLAPWARKCYEQAQRGIRIVFLCPANRMGNNYYQDDLLGSPDMNALCFVRGRVPFVDTDGNPQPQNPYDTAIFGFGNAPWSMLRMLGRTMVR